MSKRVAVGPKYRRGLYLKDENGVARNYGPGELIPEGTKLPGRFFRDKRAIWVEGEPVKKARPAQAPKMEKKTVTQSASPSPSSGVVGASAPAPLEVGKEVKEFSEKKTKRKRKKLFGSE